MASIKSMVNERGVVQRIFNAVQSLLYFYVVYLLFNSAGQYRTTRWLISLGIVISVMSLAYSATRSRHITLLFLIEALELVVLTHADRNLGVAIINPLIASNTPYYRSGLGLMVGIAVWNIVFSVFSFKGVAEVLEEAVEEVEEAEDVDEDAVIRQNLLNRILRRNV